MTDFITLSARAKNLTNQRFCRLLALGPIRHDFTTPIWLCQCDCGNMTEVASSSLLGGKTRSCGCLSRELVSARSKTHGLSHTRIYGVWINIKQRCLNLEYPTYHDYGARGITIYPDWQESFDLFFAYVSKLPGYGEHHLSIDRIDNNRGYEPDNLRWATIKQQSLNKRTNRPITYHGKTQSTAQWASELGMTYDTLKGRIREGWSIERAFVTPTQLRKPKRGKMPQYG